MATRPLFNGATRVMVDNNAIPALLNEFCFRAQVGSAPNGSTNTIGNITFQATAGSPLTIYYDIRKNGGGVQQDTPTEGRVFVFNTDDSNDAVGGAVLDSGDLIAGASLNISGNFVFTPTQSGTYRLTCWFRRVGTPSTKDWSAHADGGASFGALSDPRRASAQDKGRLRFGHSILTTGITERGSASPAKFAVTMNTAGTALQEAVRADVTQSATQNKQVAGVNTYKVKQRRNGTSTIDVNVETTIQSGTAHRTETVVDRLSYPNEGVNQSYDTLVVVERNSTLHDNNTPQYTGLGGQDADGVWVHFTGVGAGLTLTDYKTVTKLATHNADAGGILENVGAYSAKNYTEDANGVPTVPEVFSFIFTDDNMNVKSGRVLNSRSEPLKDIFIVGEVIHEASGTNLITWGNNDPSFRTRVNGWQNGIRTVTVTTPPAGIYRITATAHFPGTSFGTPAQRQFSIARAEQGSPAGIGAGKDWIAPASFSTAWVVGEEPMKGGVLKNITLNVFNKDVSGNMVFTDADFVPTVYIGKRNLATGIVADFATPTAVWIATGQYQFPFTPDVVATGTKDVYFVAADVTVGSFKRRWGENITAVSYDIVSDPDISVLCSFRPQIDGQHFQPGLAAMGSLAVYSETLGRFFQPDANSAKICFLLRGVGVDAGFFSFLDSDMVFKRVTTIADIYFWDMVESSAGSLIYLKMLTAAQTATWALGSVSVFGKCKVNGITYTEPFVGFAQSKFNSHARKKFDPTTLFE